MAGEERQSRMKFLITFLLLPPSAVTGQIRDHHQAEEQAEEGVRVTEIHGAAPVAMAHIASFYVDKATPGSDHETGNLHILYTDGIEVIETLPPKDKSADAKVALNQEGFADIEVADDKRTIGWTEMFDTCCTSYSIPLAVTVYRSGRRVLHIRQGLMVWYWTFLDGGNRFAVVWGPTHGPEAGDYQLYEAKTGRMLSEAHGDPDIQGLSAKAPKWAKQVEEQMHKQPSVVYP